MNSVTFAVDIAPLDFYTRADVIEASDQGSACRLAAGRLGSNMEKMSLRRSNTNPKIPQFDSCGAAEAALSYSSGVSYGPGPISPA